MPAPRPRHAGLTLIEASLLVSVAGVVLAIAVPAFLHALRVSKVAEATEELQRIFEHAAAYYQTPQTIDGRKHLRCLPGQAGPTPESPSVEPKAVDFAAAPDAAGATWRALGYTPRGPLRFRYSFLPTQAGCGAASGLPAASVLLTLRAEGDLDGDGVLSRFERTARDRDGSLELDPLLTVRDRIE